MPGGAMKKKSQRSLAMIGIGALLVLGFQNCSDFTLKEQLLYERGLLESKKNLDAKYLPSLLSSTSLMVWSKPSDPLFINKPMMADQWAVVLVADRAATGSLLKINSQSGIEESRIDVADGKIRAVRANNVGTVFEESLEVTAPSQGDKMVIAASFGASVSDITLMVNGTLQSGTIVQTGTPAKFTYLSKVLESQLSTGQIYEYVVYAGDSSSDSGVLNAEALNVMSRYVADNNMIPNVILDPVLLLPPTAPISSPEFIAAKSFFDGKCIQCHKAGGYSPDLVGLTEAKAVEKSWVIKGDPEGSKLYYRLKNSGGSNGPKNMPTNSDVSVSEAQVVADWINSIK